MLVPHRSLHFNIVDETDEYVVVDKPPFLLIHPTKPNGAPTQTEFYVERRFVRSMVTLSPVASRLPLDAPPGRDPDPEDEGEGQRRVHGKNSARGEEKFAVIRAIPRTGRTHQIRVHLSAI